MNYPSVDAVNASIAKRWPKPAGRKRLQLYAALFSGWPSPEPFRGF